MSTYYRRFGRFASASTSESHQRQLGAPVSKWKREWVAPEGLPAESSYKIFKWVRTDVKAQFSGIDEPSEAADYTPAPEGQGEDEGEVLEEDDEGIQEVDDEGEAEDGESKPLVLERSSPQLRVGSDGNSKPQRKPTRSPEAQLIPQSVQQPPDSSHTSPKHAEDIHEASEAPSETVLERNVSQQEESSAGPSSTTDEVTHNAAIPPHHQIPVNAVEVANIPPNENEVGKGSLGEAERTGMEVRQAEHGDSAMGTRTAEEKMDVDGPVVKEDEGLVHGEMEPPVPELAVEGVDEPVEVEQE
ncbi:hypothetical protein J010_06055 [Cryptococcus neoformans]|nr:hypothetical protein C355_05999 [Cryptococcus neoformans var. grubii Th84]OXG73703.1 hypothetical protein C350_05986 [Cryptococcus neoformans var. grubii MW-RSA36]OXH02236.1 hypothetical protein J010_06055 [Cryptococcus neoformans var. grubii]OXL10116.1 hypothetical protein C348_01850 [Cryptococcus neoformans var. grubii Gb118]OXH23986.1 hypothetical protein J009_06046 [Cryptococcus neoformans var. grubii]